MSNISSLGTAVSGLLAAQKGLSVTGHNITNVNTEGYTRQQLLQHDEKYLTIRKTGAGLYTQKGFGVSETEIRQIRDEFTDLKFRNENSVLSFYNTKNTVISEIEFMLDEPYGEAISTQLDSFWSQTQKLSTNPSGVEERMTFIQGANALIGRIDQIQEGLVNYQDNLNNQIIEQVNRINELSEEINQLNEKITLSELNGDNANDYRDLRNNALDELSGYISINYDELPNGSIRVKTDTGSLVDQGIVSTLEFAQTEPLSPYIKPIWKGTGTDLFTFTKEGQTNSPLVNADNENDEGSLKALVLSRGEERSDKNTPWEDIAINDHFSVDTPGNAYTIPKFQKQLDMLTNTITNIVNGTMNGEGLGDHEGIMGVPVFVPIRSEVLVPKLPANPTAAQITEYNSKLAKYYEDIKPDLTSGNIQINPELLEESGYNKLGTVTQTGDIGDNTKVQELLNQWGEAREWNTTDAYGNPVTQPPAPSVKTLDVQDFYAELISELGQEGYDSASRMKEKIDIVNSINNERLAVSATSQDEELSMMMKYQYAYNSSARMITMLDGMMDLIINRM